jgi:3-oxoacyl-[acyl-carrier-protein] synthase III
MSARAAVLCAVARHVPRRRVPNHELAGMIGVDTQWIIQRTGIRQRYFAAEGEATSDLAVAAGAKALAAAGAGAGADTAADAVILATTTPDHPCPATAPLIAERLGLRTPLAMDVSAACAGFVYGLGTAAGLIAAGIAQRVLLIGAETYSTILAPGDRVNGAIFGDGAGAVVLRAGDPAEPGAVGPFHFASDGSGHELITVRAGGSRGRSTGKPPEPGDEFFSMNGQAVYRTAIRRMTESCRHVLDQAGVPVGAVDWLVPHQANLRILRAVAANLGMPAERCVANIALVGNTAAASIPIALADASADGTLAPGQRVLLTAFGGGLAWGSCYLRWPHMSNGRDWSPDE